MMSQIDDVIKDKNWWSDWNVVSWLIVMIYKANIPENDCMGVLYLMKDYIDYNYFIILITYCRY